MKHYRRVMMYVAVLIFIIMLYGILPRIWWLIPRSISNLFYPFLYPLRSYAIQYGFDPIAVTVTIPLIVGLFVTILFCLLMMREFERAITEFTYDIKKKLTS